MNPFPPWPLFFFLPLTTGGFQALQNRKTPWSRAGDSDSLRFSLFFLCFLRSSVIIPLPESEYWPYLTFQAKTVLGGPRSWDRHQEARRVSCDYRPSRAHDARLTRPAFPMLHSLNHYLFLVLALYFAAAPFRVTGLVARFFKTPRPLRP